MIEPYLEDLERRIDPEIEEDLLAQWIAFTEGKFEGPIFSPQRARPAPAGLEWPHVPVNDALDDFELMALQQFGAASAALGAGSGALMTVRCNYGTGILPTLFGAALYVMEREMDTLPTSIPLGGLETTTIDASIQDAASTPAADAVHALLERGVPDLRTGLGARVFDMAAWYEEVMARYPKIRRYVHVYHPDLQGPMDVCELLWGSSLFVALVEVPDLVRQLLDLVTETYVQFMRRWDREVPSEGPYARHWSMLHKGHIMLRDDSAMNLSPRMFDTFIRPYDARLLRELGGGALHFCGRGDHYIRLATEMEGLYAINMSQPEYNAMETIFAHTVDRGIPLIGFPRPAAEEALRQGRDLKGRVHCF